MSELGRLREEQRRLLERHARVEARLGETKAMKEAVGGIGSVLGVASGHPAAKVVLKFAFGVAGASLKTEISRLESKSSELEEMLEEQGLYIGLYHLSMFNPATSHLRAERDALMARFVDRVAQRSVEMMRVHVDSLRYENMYDYTPPPSHSTWA